IIRSRLVGWQFSNSLIRDKEKLENLTEKSNHTQMHDYDDKSRIRELNNYSFKTRWMAIL
ncbi:MAG: hypothetical protein IKH88_13535, partial [Prevotella sp.]|nr:hypothetical protein [Prevotella sp.]